jgi:hypothetical protein
MSSWIEEIKVIFSRINEVPDGNGHGGHLFSQQKLAGWDE